MCVRVCVRADLHVMGFVVLFEFALIHSWLHFGCMWFANDSCKSRSLLPQYFVLGVSSKESLIGRP